MKFNKMILGLNTHLYAPELNTLALKNGVKLSVPGCLTVQEAKIFLGFYRVVFIKAAQIDVKYPPEFASANNRKSGVINSLKSLQLIKRITHNNRYIDADTLIDSKGYTGRIKPAVNVSRLLFNHPWPLHQVNNLRSITS